MAGACMLWVGWFGFNAGSALKAGGDAGMAMTVTHISAATAALVWLVIESVKFGKPSVIGIVTGAVAGLATITPASGFVGPAGAVIIGLVGGGVCYAMVILIKRRLKIDDFLDVFAVHGVGGAVGVVLTALLIDATLGGAGLAEGRSAGDQLAISASRRHGCALMVDCDERDHRACHQVAFRLACERRYRGARPRSSPPWRARLQYVTGIGEAV